VTQRSCAQRVSQEAEAGHYPSALARIVGRTVAAPGMIGSNARERCQLQDLKLVSKRENLKVHYGTRANQRTDGCASETATPQPVDQASVDSLPMQTWRIEFATRTSRAAVTRLPSMI
jgi:hypothetical protein